jgi:hypothetical protein
MRQHRFLALASIAILAIVATTSGSRSAAKDDDKPQAATANPFEGKYLVIRLDRALDEHAAYLKEVRIRKIGDDAFLVGTGFGLGSKSNWYVGRNIWLSLHHVE